MNIIKVCAIHALSQSGINISLKNLQQPNNLF